MLQNTDGGRWLSICSQNTADNAVQTQTSTSIRFNSDKVWMGTYWICIREVTDSDAATSMTTPSEVDVIRVGPRQS